ncbi:MAG: hypothetical protein LAT82_04725 [Nanoarchaeota archaeon]|nr:hypothetical protein [Nanoarchaeota archaeon]
MTILLAYRLHKGNKELDDVLPILRTQLKGLESQFGEVKESFNFDPLGFENLDCNGLYVPLLYSPECLTGKHYERRFEREFEHYSKKNISSLLLQKNGLQISNYRVIEPSTTEKIQFGNNDDLIGQVRNYVAQKNPTASLNQRAA